jgi:hypothetical protein
VWSDWGGSGYIRDSGGRQLVRAPPGGQCPPPDTPRRPAPLAFRSLMRPFLAEIYLCHACSCQEIEDDEARRPMLAEIYICHAWSGHETDCGYAVPG